MLVFFLSNEFSETVGDDAILPICNKNQSSNADKEVTVMEPRSRLPFLDWEENDAQTGGCKNEGGRKNANAINKFHAQKYGSYTFSHVPFCTTELFFLGGFFFLPQRRAVGLPFRFRRYDMHC